MSENKNFIPRCVGFIMDGNRRWAKALGKSTLEGHLAGKEKLFDVVEWVVEAKIPHAVFYAFSTENWKRNKDEVEALLGLFSETIKSLQAENEKRKVTVRIIGRRQDFSPDLQQAINELEEMEKNNPFDTTTIWIALSYGGRAEIIEAVNKAVQLGEEVNEENFSNLLWTAGMVDPDIIVRTGGEKRLSNFLPWQTVYSEFFFIETFWPAFTKSEFTSILNEYAARERRIGK